VRKSIGFEKKRQLNSKQDSHKPGKNVVSQACAFLLLVFACIFFTETLFSNVIFLPKGQLFYPLIADPKQPHFFLGTRYYVTPSQNFLAGVAGFGKEFGLIRWTSSSENEGFQLSVDGSLSAQFNSQSPSTHLINTDYSGGIPISWRRGDFSILLRPYYQSSHLGEELFLTTKIDRINLTYEAVQLLFSQEWRSFRFYGGGEVLVRCEPSDLGRWIIHGGSEWIRREIWFWKAKPFVALDLKSYQENAYFVDTSLKGGLDFSGNELRLVARRHLRLLLEAYYGYSPHGQFYADKNFFAGLGMAFTF